VVGIVYDETSRIDHLRIGLADAGIVLPSVPADLPGADLTGRTLAACHWDGGVLILDISDPGTGPPI
jgi:hypothetical protein